jgi:tetratricopeptide (TPR) repeat protein
LYADLLNHCDRTGEAADVFNRLAEDPNAAWRDAATLELLKIKLSNSATPTQSNEVLAKLRDFILRCNQPDEKTTRLRLVAMNIYCTKLLYQDSNDSAEKILYILDKAQPTPDLGDEFFRASALKQLGRLEESAHCMSKALDDIDSSRADYLFSLLSEILDKIELWQQKAGDFNQMLFDCNTLAEFVNKNPKSQKTIPPFAEISILRSDLDRAEFLLNPLADENNVGRLRPKARLLMAQNKFEQSAKLWAKIAESRRNETTGSNQKSYGWWQAKFYELYCLAKTPQPDKQNIRHAIEVLQNTYTDIPTPWAEKLNGLKESCGN